MVGHGKKEAHTSHYGISIIIDIISNVVSDYCHDCNTAAQDLGEASPEYEIWKSSHVTNFNGSSGSTEISAGHNFE